MSEKSSLISEAFQAFVNDASAHQRAWAKAVQELGEAGTLDPKTGGLAYIAVLAAAGLISGIPFHVRGAKENGASRDEVISAVLVGLPAVGNRVIQALPAAIKAYDME